MSLEALVAGITAAAELLPPLLSAIRAGDKQAARDLAEEAARREAWAAKQRSKGVIGG